MKWFKHDSDANLDDKLQNLMLDHGLKGYGLYWYCLELIANKFDHTNINLELKHDARIISKNTGETVKEVEDIMKRMVELDLFSQSQGIIQCLKLGTRFEASASSHPLVRDTVKKLKAVNGEFMTKSQHSHNIVTADKNRIEENRKEKQYSEDFERFYEAYPKRKAKPIAFKAWLKHKPDINVVLKSLIMHKKSDQWTKNKGEFIPYPASWLNAEGWNDEIETKKVNSTYASFIK